MLTLDIDPGIAPELAESLRGMLARLGGVAPPWLRVLRVRAAAARRTG